ncbi:MAG: YchJ family protein [Proteobacteria bacterium]|nr:YchJ family protein [Pseudomonadota bacterium]
MESNASVTLCPCGSGRNLDDCCGPIIAGAPATTPEALMRSRYCAFVLGKLDHVDRTHAPEIRDDFNRAEAERSAEECEWLGLEVKNATESGDEGTVEFVARFKRGGQTFVQHERAAFCRRDGHWLYLAGEINPTPPQRHVTRIGRNDPCACGSGKKYKKCCGA